MKINDVIKRLEKIRKESGNIEVKIYVTDLGLIQSIQNIDHILEVNGKPPVVEINTTFEDIFNPDIT